MRKTYRWMLIIFFSLPGFVFAEDKPAFSIPNDFSISQPVPSNFKISGYLDVSYNYLEKNNTFTSGIHDRVYDLTLNGFTLQQGSITLAYQPEWGWGGVVNPVIGRDAYTAAPYGWNPYYGSEWVGFFVPQAYLQYAIHSFTFIAGSFMTLAGSENLDPTTDTNFSRSLLGGYAEPSTHLGIRGTYVSNDKLTLVAGLNNGWDNIRDTGRRKTIELSMTYKPHPIFSFQITGYSGGQRSTDNTSFGSESIRNLLNIVTTFNVSDKFTFIADYDYGIQSKATLPTGDVDEAIFTGITGYANYSFNEEWRTSLRGEVFDDREGYRTGVPQCLKEVTFTVGYVPIKHVELRAETRRDFSNVSSFVTTGRNGVSNNNQSFSLEGVYRVG